MKSLKLGLFAVILALPFAVSANAQIAVGIGVGPAVVPVPVDYGPPVCDWGYYPYYPYARALLEAVPGLTILHQAGARHAEITEAAYRDSGADPARWQVSGFLDDMPARFAHANLVMARSGASTVAELAAAGKPALLVPFAAAADDHQTRNAEEMVNVGAALMLKEPDLADHARVLDSLVQLLKSSERLAAMSAAALTQAHPQAAQTIADRIVSLAK